MLLVNLGTPKSFSRDDVKTYLNEFLSDRRVVDAPRWYWLPLLRCMILPIRSGASARLYESIWTDQGSPLKQHTQRLCEKLTQVQELPVDWAMCYGEDNIAKALTAFKEKDIKAVKVIPLYPQYSHSTIGSVNDKVDAFCQKNSGFTSSVLQGYSQNKKAAEICANQLKPVLEDNPEAHVLFSFHGLPKRYVREGDP